MQLLINSSSDQADWDQFIQKHPEGNLLQSWSWGEFQEALGNPIWRFRVVDEKNETLSQLLAIKLALGFGKFILYTPREVLINRSASAHTQHQAMELIVAKIKELAKAERLILWRTDPPLKRTDTAALSIYKSFGFVSSQKSIQPRTNWLLAIDAKPTNLLAAMKPKTRYNIRLAEKKNVEVVRSRNNEDIRIFNQLNRETAIRDKFTPYSDNYYKKQLEILGRAGLMELLIAYWNNIPLAAVLIAHFGPHAVYLHGASSSEHREKMANHAIQWAAILEAQNKGCATYDLGGISWNNEDLAWAGITRFKQGFGGRAAEYIGTLELPLSPLWYRFYRVLRNH